MANFDRYLGAGGLGSIVPSAAADASLECNDRIIAENGRQYFKIPGGLTLINGARDQEFADAFPNLCAIATATSATGQSSFLATLVSASVGGAVLGKIGSNYYAIPMGVSGTVASSSHQAGFYSANVDFQGASNYTWANIRGTTWANPQSSVLITSKEILCSFEVATNSVITRSTGGAGTFTVVSSALTASQPYRLACNTAESLYVAAYSCAGNIFTSTDAVTWTLRVPIGGGGVNVNFAYWCPYLGGGAGRFVYLGSNGEYFHSSDGYTATAYATTGSVQDAFGHTLTSSTFFSVGTGRTSAHFAHSANATCFASPAGILRTSDSISWDYVSSTVLQAIWYSGSTFYGLTKHGQLMRSTNNGTTWEGVSGFVHETAAALVGGKRALLLGAHYVAADDLVIMAFGPSDCFDGGSVFRINAAGSGTVTAGPTYIGAWPSVSGTTPNLVRIN